MIVNYDNERLKLSTGISISPKQWNANQQRAKELMSYPENREINLNLETQKVLLLKVFNSIIKRDGIVERSVLKEEFLIVMNSPKRKKKKLTFWDYFEEFIKYKSDQLNDIKDYNNSLRKHILATERLYKRKATFEGLKNLNGSFVNSMRTYLTEEAINSKGTKGLTVNTVGKQFKNLKVFINWCFDNNYIKIFSIKHIVNTTEEVDAVYLEESEIESLIKLNLNDDDERRVRDGFVLSCNTALRFGDLSKLRNAHITYKDGKGTISIQQEKTRGRKIAIPIDKVSKKILDRYDNTSPINQIKSAQFNTTIKELCKRAKINDSIVIYRTEKRKRVEYDYKKYELVSSHTARRTFCTLKMKQKVPIDLIMSISGHKSYKSFFRYLKMRPDDYVEEMRKYMK